MTLTEMTTFNPFEHFQVMSVLNFIILALAVFRITRLIMLDEILAPVRNVFWEKFPPETSYLGFLFTCEWCVSMWVALPVVLFYAAFPTMTLLIGCIFALSAVSSLITARLDN
jgi:hypothetical protein